MTRPSSQSPRIEVRLEGPEVPGRIRVDTLTAVARELQLSLRRMLASPRRGTGRFRTDIEQICALDLTSFASGSAVLTFEFAGPRDRDTLQGDPGVRVAAEMIDLMQKAEAGETGWDAALPAGVIDGWENLSRPVGDGVHLMSITLIEGQRRQSAHLTKAFRQNLHGATPPKPEVDVGQIEGVLWECDWKERTAQLDEADGNRVPLVLPEGLDERVTELRRQRVRVSGNIERASGRIVRVRVTQVAPAQGSAETPDPRFGGFWENLSLDETARRQGVQPVEDLERLAIEWPEAESADEFLAPIRELRRP